MPQPPGDDCILTKALSGDDLAVQELLFYHHDRLVACISAQIPKDAQSVVAAEDVCQEAYIATIRNLGRFHGKSHEAFFSWLRTIAENKLVDTLRAYRAAKRGGGAQQVEFANQGSSVVDILAILAVHSRTPSRSLRRVEAIRIVHEAIDRLPGDQCEAIRLRYLEGLAVAEIARRMARSEPAVRALCHRAIKRLEQELGDPDQFLTRFSHA